MNGSLYIGNATLEEVVKKILRRHNISINDEEVVGFLSNFARVVQGIGYNGKWCVDVKNVAETCGEKLKKENIWSELYFKEIVIRELEATVLEEVTHAVTNYGNSKLKGRKNVFYRMVDHWFF